MTRTTHSCFCAIASCAEKKLRNSSFTAFNRLAVTTRMLSARLEDAALKIFSFSLRILMSSRDFPSLNNSMHCFVSRYHRRSFVRQAKVQIILSFRSSTSFLLFTHRIQFFCSFLPLFIFFIWNNLHNVTDITFQCQTNFI